MIKEWFLSKNQNERRLIVGITVLAVILLFYSLVAAPFLDNLQQHRRTVATQENLISWMQETAATIQQLGSHTGAATSVPLLTLIDRSARQHRLGSYMHRLEPQGSSTAQIWFKQIPFDNLVRWLQAIHQQYGVIVDSLGIQRQDKPGIVDARIVLTGGKK